MCKVATISGNNQLCCMVNQHLALWLVSSISAIQHDWEWDSTSTPY
jgi:hypothetical protein